MKALYEQGREDQYILIQFFFLNKFNIFHSTEGTSFLSAALFTGVYGVPKQIKIMHNNYLRHLFVHALDLIREQTYLLAFVAAWDLSKSSKFDRH